MAIHSGTSKRSSGQRGTAAAEFALVLMPLMFFFFFVIQSGRGFYIKYMMMNLANTVVRSCTLQQQPMDESGTTPNNVTGPIQNCVSATYAQITTGDYNWSNACPNSSSAQFSVLTIPGGSTPEYPNNYLKLMHVSVTCKLPYGVPLMPGSFDIVGEAAMPFIE